MKLEKINRLFAAYNSNTSATQKTAQEKQIQEASAKVEEAVTVAKNFGSSADAAKAEQARFERIKSEVQGGTYKADSREVAKSLIRDLFA